MTRREAVNRWLSLQPREVVGHGRQGLDDRYPAAAVGLGLQPGVEDCFEVGYSLCQESGSVARQDLAPGEARLRCGLG